MPWPSVDQYQEKDGRKQSLIKMVMKSLKLDVTVHTIGNGRALNMELRPFHFSYLFYAFWDCSFYD